jgi:hypothetical protein
MGKVMPTDNVRVPDAKRFKMTREEVAAMRETLGKCVNPLTGEPVSARREETAILPVPGTVEGAEDGNGTGTCPECGAHVKLSGKGFVTAHSVRRMPVPAHKSSTKERQTPATDTGSRVGSPDAAERTRAAELSGATGTDTVKIKVRNQETGKSEDKDVPATEANIRTALRQEQRRKSPDAARLSRLGSMLRGATGTVAVPVIGAQPGTYKVFEAVTLDAANAPEGRDERKREDGGVAHVPTSPGPALVQGHSMSGAVPTDRQRVTRGGKPRNAIGWNEPVGRQRVDRVVTTGTLRTPDECEGKGCTVSGCVAIVGGQCGYLTCAEFRALPVNGRKHYWGHVTVNKRRAEAARERMRRPVVPGRGYVSREPVSRAGIQRV